MLYERIKISIPDIKALQYIVKLQLISYDCVNKIFIRINIYFFNKNSNDNKFIFIHIYTLQYNRTL